MHELPFLRLVFLNFPKHSDKASEVSQRPPGGWVRLGGKEHDKAPQLLGRNTCHLHALEQKRRHKQTIVA